MLFLDLDLCDVLRFYRDVLAFCLLLGLGHTNPTSVLRSILKYLKLSALVGRQLPVLIAHVALEL